MIEVVNASKHYPTLTAIDRISFTVAEGEIVAFLGPNGAGKTTTMRILTCFMPPSEGVVRVAGFDCVDHPMSVKQHIGYLPEMPPLYLELTVREYLQFVGRLKSLSPERITARITHVIDQLELGDVQHRVLGYLSRGFRQRVGLAQALLHDPPVLVLDEPTVGLDPKQIIEIRELIRSLAGSHTIILSTHILPEATAVCQRVIIIHQGCIVAVDTPEQLAVRLRRSEKIRLTVKAPPPHWEETLRSFSGVTNVMSDSGTPSSFLIESEVGHDIREDLARMVVNQGIGLLELHPLSMTLEDVFLQLTQDEPPPSSRSSSGASPVPVQPLNVD